MSDERLLLCEQALQICTAGLKLHSCLVTALLASRVAQQVIVVQTCCVLAAGARIGGHKWHWQVHGPEGPFWQAQAQLGPL